MKSLKTKALIFATGSLMVLAAACAQPPANEIGTAEAALNAAREAEAAVYAPEAWNAAQAALTAASSEVAAQQAKFALLRSYSKAKQMLAEAESSARNAEQAGIEGREAAGSAAEDALTQVKSELETANTLLSELAACPRKPKGFAQDLALLRGDLQGMAASLPDAELAYSEGQFKDALSQAQSLSTEIAAFTQELSNAKSKIKC